MIVKNKNAPNDFIIAEEMISRNVQCIKWNDKNFNLHPLPYSYPISYKKYTKHTWPYIASTQLPLLPPLQGRRKK